MSRVDVVVPCYNYGHHLPGCIESIVTQHGVEVRALIIDDCSTDDSADVATEIADADARIETYRHEHNRGHIATYNEGLLDWADGDYVVLLSADDLLAPGALARAAQVMDADPRVGMVYGWAPYFLSNDELPRVRLRRKGVTRWSGEEWIEGRCRAGYNVISSPEVVVRQDVQHRAGGYDPSLPHAGDLEMWLRIAANSDIAYVRGDPQAYYRVHAGSMQRTQFSQHLDDLRQRREVYDYAFSNALAHVSRATELHRLAKRALASEALWRACRAYDRDSLDSIDVESLVEFARSTFDDVESLPEHRALRRRQLLGPAICHRSQVFALPAAQRRLVNTCRHWRWKRTGV